MHRKRVRPAVQAAGDEHPVDVLGGLLRAGDQRDVVAEHVGDHAGQQRVVGAAEDQGVDLLLQQRVEVLVRRGEQVGPGGLARLHELDEARAGPRDQARGRWRGRERVVVRLRLGGRARADHADPATAGGGDGAARGGEDHLDHRHVVPLTCVTEHRGARGVARDDQGLHALVDEVVEALEGVLAHLAERLHAVGLACRVTQVEHRLVRQLVDHGPSHGEPTEAGVEDADGRVRHA